MKAILATIALLLALGAPWPHWVNGIVRSKHIHVTKTQTGQILTSYHLVLVDGKGHVWTCNEPYGDWVSVRTGYYWTCYGYAGMP